MATGRGDCQALGQVRCPQWAATRRGLDGLGRGRSFRGLDGLGGLGRFRCLVGAIFSLVGVGGGRFGLFVSSCLRLAPQLDGASPSASGRGKCLGLSGFGLGLLG